MSSGLAAGSKYEYSDAAHLYATSYVRNSKAIGVLWGIFTICFAIIDIVVFVQPQWLGDTVSSRGTGHFGLWRRCHMVQDSSGHGLLCVGRLDDFAAIPSAAFRAATVFVGLSVVLVLLCICCLLLFFFFHASTVFHICGWSQLLSAVCLIVGVLTYPAGWDATEIRDVCGPQARDYRAGDCAIRWAYILAIIGCVDIVILASLAFVLGTRYVTLSTSSDKAMALAPVYKGELNSGFVPDNHSTTSRKSMNLQPVLLMPQPATGSAGGGGGGGAHDNDRFSDYSHRTDRRPKSSVYRDQYSSSMHNYRL